MLSGRLDWQAHDLQASYGLQADAPKTRTAVTLTMIAVTGSTSRSKKIGSACATGIVLSCCAKEQASVWNFLSKNKHSTTVSKPS